MCDKFFEAVGVPEETLFSSPLNVIHQIGENVEGAFISHFMLGQFFRKYNPAEGDNARALVISSHHSKGHWMSVGTKLGTNLAVLEEKGALTVIDLMKEVFDHLKSEQPKPTPDNPSFCLKSLFSRCENAIQDFKKTSGSGRILVIVEDLTNFLQSNDESSKSKFRNSERLILEFILKLKALSILYQEDKCSVTISCLIQSPEVPSESPERTRFAKSLSQTVPSILFEVSPLNTGFSSQVTGYLKVSFNPDAVSHVIKKVETPFIRNFHFKLESNGARVIPL